MTLSDLKQKITDAVTVLKTFLDRIRESLSELADAESGRSSLAAQLTETEQRLNGLVRATPVELSRLKITPEQARKSADELQAKLETVAAEVAAKDTKINALRNSISETSQAALKTCRQVSYDAELFARAAITSMIGSIVDPTSLDVVYETTHGRFSDLYSQTEAAAIIYGRRKAVDRAEIAGDLTAAILPIAEAILVEPIPTLARRSIEASLTFDERGHLHMGR